MGQSKKCGYKFAWIGQCQNHVVGASNMCSEHVEKKCVSCGAPAMRECQETGSFVCGAPLCNECEHTVYKDGTNGGIEFYATSKRPKGYGEHCKKSEQVCKP